jgi:DNA mismatch repair protein MutH
VLLEDDEAVSDMTIGIFQVLNCWWLLHSISDCLIIIFTVPFASISIPYHTITPLPSIVRNHARWFEESHDPRKNKVIWVLVRIQKTIQLHDHCTIQ